VNAGKGEVPGESRWEGNPNAGASLNAAKLDLCENGRLLIWRSYTRFVGPRRLRKRHWIDLLARGPFPQA
jgi:hypothetical protein